MELVPLITEQGSVSILLAGHPLHRKVFFRLPASS